MQQGVRKTTSFTIFDPTGKFIPNPNDKFFWIGRKFKIYIGLQRKEYAEEPTQAIYQNDSNSTISLNSLSQGKDDILKFGDSLQEQLDTYWFSKGVYILTDISSSQSSEGTVVSISGVDKFGAFGNETGYGEMIGTFGIDAGTTIDWAIREILHQDIGNGIVIDPQPPIIDPYFQQYKLPLDIMKGPGSYLNELLNDLAAMLHADIYYDNDGHLNMWRSLNYDDYKSLTKSWDFVYGDQEYVQAQVQYDLLNVVNSIYVVGDNPSANILPIAWSENRNPKSPISIQKIGRKSRYIESSTIQTEKEARDYADYLLKMYSILGHTISLVSTFMPHLEIDQIITVTDERLGYETENFIVSGLSIPIGLGTITINGSNIGELPEA